MATAQGSPEGSTTRDSTYPLSGEEMAQSCANACFKQLHPNAVSRISLNLGRGLKISFSREVKAVVGDVVHTSNGHEDHENPLCPSWEFI
jgi:hypothetical protein